MSQIIRVGMDTSKHVFQLHGVNGAEEVVLRRKLRRKEMVAFFQNLPPALVAIEACGASHHWARILSAFGHEVKLIAPQLAEPYVKRGKNDAADAEALCEAASRRALLLDPQISIATVYRTVRLLEETGVVERHDFRDGRSRYEETPAKHHDHLIDLTSGVAIEFMDEEIEALQEAVARRLGYRLVGHRLELYAEPAPRAKAD